MARGRAGCVGRIARNCSPRVATACRWPFWSLPRWRRPSSSHGPTENSTQGLGAGRLLAESRCWNFLLRGSGRLRCHQSTEPEGISMPRYRVTLRRSSVEIVEASNQYQAAIVARDLFGDSVEVADVAPAVGRPPVSKAGRKASASKATKKVAKKRRPLSPEARAKLAQNLVKARAARAAKGRAAKRAAKATKSAKKATKRVAKKR